MSSKDTDTRAWSDPKDYGLPFVEITPLNPQPSLPKEKQEVKKAVPVQVENKVEQAEKEPIPVSEDKPKVDPTKVKDQPKPKVEKKAKSNAWVWVVVFMALAVLGVIVWQLQLTQIDSTSQPVESDRKEDFSTQSDVPAQPELTPSEETLIAENQDSITTINNSNPNISKPAETGTTIANTVSGNLIRIESKSDKVRYFIVVSSLPKEQLALEIAAKFAGKTPELYLITPYESSPNYRVAIGKFDTWKAAADEVARIKSQYSEDLWILNY
ncbi:SPOR domain-containing protein [Algoriphagus sp. AK58]|uniref:SPOR domain-containing protein n=1 Tax=Algoriphagus sp. AK58 TaxID=1406877 RepID=UPI00164F3F9F|nr:SPOR domain-containing protein [Algoriphagus sp. AK58]